MNLRPAANRRRMPRTGCVRHAQGGTAVRGVIVVAGIAAALALQLAGPRLQCRLADLVGVPSAAPVPTPAAMPSCGSSSGVNSMHSCKVANAASAVITTVPVI